MTSVLVTIEQRFDRTGDGAVWAPQFDYRFWTRYLEVFDSVRVVARMRDVEKPHASSTRCDGPGVAFESVPYYLGPAEYVRRLASVHRAVRAALRPGDAVILRIDSQLAVSLEGHLRASKRPYGVEVVVDPYDAFAPGSIEHPLRAFFRWWFVWRTRAQVARASAAAYVTRSALQERYPARAGAFTTYFSSVELEPAGFVAKPRDVFGASGAFTLIMVALLDQLRKGPDTVMRAMRRLGDDGVPLRFVLVGDGSLRPYLEGLAAELDLREQVVFAGQLDRASVRRALDAADAFVMPSHGEGLPRAAIEAMARGLPVVGSQIGGFRELVDDRYLVPAGDPDALAEKLRWLVTDRNLLTSTSARNLEAAQEYRSEILTARRRAFYSALRKETEAFWS